MMVGHCHSHPAHIHGQGHQNNGGYHHRNHHSHRISRSGSESSREESEQFSSGGSSSSSATIGNGSGRVDSGNTTASSSDYSLAISSSDMGERTLRRHPSTASLLDSIERRTQRTYRYGIGLVCVGATLNWLGFAQGTNHIDPLRYLGVACVLTGSFCVCLAMCRWLSKPISVSGHHVSNLEDERPPGDVHVINVAVPMYVPNLHEEYRQTKPPDYEQIIAGEDACPPPYDEAVKLRPSEFFGTPTPSHHVNPMSPGVIMDATSAGEGGGHHMYISQFTQSSCQLSPSHHHNHSTHHHDLTQALLLDHQDTENLIAISTAPTPTPTPTPCHVPQQPHIHQYLRRTSTPVQEDPPPYEPSPRPSISSLAPLIPTSSSRFDLPPSFSVRRLFGGVVASPSSSSPRHSPIRRRDSNSNNNNSSSFESNTNEHLHDQVINEDATLSLVVHHQQEQQQQNFMPSLQLGNSDILTSNVNNNNNI